MYFYEMIKLLREKEEVLLYENILTISNAERAEVRLFLEEEFEKESLSYPHVPPTFNAETATWAAEVVYLAAQLVLFRKNQNIEALIPPAPADFSQSAILSADLCLRFIPDLIIQLIPIDPEDELITVLKSILEKWNYSGIKATFELEISEIDPFLKEACLRQLYLNRITKTRNRKLAAKPEINCLLLADFGLYPQQYWPDFIPLTQDE